MRSTGRFQPRALLPWLGALLVLVAVGVVVWRGPLRPGPASLDLLAYDERGSFVDRVHLSPVANDPRPGSPPRMPLLLALRNDGPAPISAGAVVLSLPSWLSLENEAGEPLAHERLGGNPLASYRISFDPIRLEPGRFPTVLPAASRLWVRPFNSPWRCRLDDEGRPAFIPAPQLDPASLADVVAFWSVEEAGSDRRGTGNFSISLDPTFFDIPPAAQPPAYPAERLPADAPRPDLATLPLEGRQHAACGGAIEPLTVQSAVYRAGAGRILVVSTGDTLRRWLFDLDGDSIVEAEAWDARGSGRLDLARHARYPIPEFLLPPPPPPPPTAPDSGVVSDTSSVAGRP